MLAEELERARENIDALLLNIREKSADFRSYLDELDAEADAMRLNAQGFEDA